MKPRFDNQFPGFEDDDLEYEPLSRREITVLMAISSIMFLIYGVVVYLFLTWIGS